MSKTDSRSELNLRGPMALYSVALFAIVLLRNAWLCDDAYIVLRVVDNFVNGLGLIWNPGERVQAFTNPLWTFLVSGIYFFSHEAFYTVIVLSAVVSLSAVSLFAFRIAGSTATAVLGILVLTMSKAFIDFSSSGLENPITHLLLACFFLLYFQPELDRKRLILVSLISGLGVLNRMDTILLFAPPLVAALMNFPKGGSDRLTAFGVFVLGFVPFIFWECFSLLYYGFPFPNTAYAKLDTGIGALDLVRQGLQYFLNSLALDPLTVVAIAVGGVLPFITKDKKSRPASVGIILYLLYILSIGGDFMSGRFFSAPLFCAVIILSQYRIKSRSAVAATAVAVTLLGMFRPNLWSMISKSDSGRTNTIDDKGIADERQVYSKWSSLAQGRPSTNESGHPWAVEGRFARLYGPRVVTRNAIGLFGYFAGPTVHVVDENGIADPLLARMPTISDRGWRIGHFRRSIPEGYLESLEARKNLIVDKTLARYYDRLSIITKGEIFDSQRLGEVWNMNLGL
ncbi:MAG TPA: hypothetical protein VIH68_06365 [Bacteroidota bacterium]